MKKHEKICVILLMAVIALWLCVAGIAYAGIESALLLGVWEYLAPVLLLPVFLTKMNDVLGGSYVVFMVLGAYPLAYCLTMWYAFVGNGYPSLGFAIVGADYSSLGIKAWDEDAWHRLFWLAAMLFFHLSWVAFWIWWRWRYVAEKRRRALAKEQANENLLAELENKLEKKPRVSPSD